MKNLKVKFVILQNKQGGTRLSNWYININEEEKIKIHNEVNRTIILRDIKESNIIEYKNYKIVYKNMPRYILCLELILMIMS